MADDADRTDKGPPKKPHLGRWFGATLVSIVIAGITAFAVGVGSKEADRVESTQASLSYSSTQVGGECGWGTYVPEPAAQHLLQAERPHDWSVVEHEPGAAAFNLNGVQVSIQGESDRTVVLTGIRFTVRHLARPAGALFQEPCGGPIIGRAIEADLDVSPPRIIATSSDPQGVVGAEQNGRAVTRPITFPWTVSVTDPLLLYVIATTTNCYCRWSAELPWVSAATRTFTLPKNGQTREAPLTDPAREALVALPIEGEFCFAPIRGRHWTASARAYHWKAVKAAAGWAGSLYLATRHFAGCYMVNVLDLPSEDVAIALGHTDGGELVRRLYGHRDRDRALDRVAAAYGRTASFGQMQLGVDLGMPSQDPDTLTRNGRSTAGS